MLVLSRRLNEKILLPNISASIEVLDIKGDRVRLGIDAPADVTILREEVALRDGLKPDQMAGAAAAQNLLKQQRHQIRNQLNLATVGLSLARRQMEAGQIAGAENTLDKISEGFQAISQQIDHIGGAPAKPVCGRRPSALLVEDDHNECELLAGFFRLAGYDVATAKDGADALTYLQDHATPDLMLLDMVLPRCDGPTTIRMVRRDPALANLKIYAVSGYTPDQVGLDLKAAGVDRWFQKPLNPEALLRELNAAHCVPQPA